LYTSFNKKRILDFIQQVDTSLTGWGKVEVVVVGGGGDVAENKSERKVTKIFLI